MRRPQPVRFTISEGGDWIAWEERKKLNGPPAGIVAHSVEFDDGVIFDMFNGWRKENTNG